MTILALEFSSEQRSVALARNGIVLSEAVETSGGRATNAFGLIEQVMTAAKTSRDAIEAVAVGLGPGSYTGIRAAIALAQGWQLARGVKLLGVNSAECLAAQAQAEKIFGRVNVVIDAQRGEFYLAAWQISDGRCEAVLPLKIVAAGEIERLKNEGAICLGPDGGKVLFPRAAMVATLAAERTDFVAGEKLEPVYLRETAFVKAPPSKFIAG
ncbi:MAG TPA: tRNA (adenosine(37)-N6)-threonylcarbamoyltransferase complex dimerization subunit type 1 TsaB [Verrucomicrobiae bacterium]